MGDSATAIYNFMLEQNADIPLKDLTSNFPNLEKKQINSILYNQLQKQGLIEKVKDVPPIWKVVTKPQKESTSSQKESTSSQKESTPSQKESTSSQQDYATAIYNFMLEQNADIPLKDLTSNFPNLEKKEINRILYNQLQKQGLAEKVKDVPPIWKAVTKTNTLETKINKLRISVPEAKPETKPEAKQNNNSERCLTPRNSPQREVSPRIKQLRSSASFERDEAISPISKTMRRISSYSDEDQLSPRVSKLRSSSSFEREESHSPTTGTPLTPSLTEGVEVNFSN